MARLPHPENQGTGQGLEHPPGHPQFVAREDPLVGKAGHFVLLLPSSMKDRRPKPE